MQNGTYKAIKNTTVTGGVAMAFILDGQIVTVTNGDHDDTVFIGCGPGCVVEISRVADFSAFELLD